MATIHESNNLHRQTPSGTLPEFIELSVNMDEERILFGSADPYYRYPTQIAIVEAADIRKTKRKIFYENFQNLFNQK